jgi:hypothetical protein
VQLKHLKQSLFNLQSVDWGVCLLKLLDFVDVKFHQFSVLVRVRKLLVGKLVMPVNDVNAIQKAGDNRGRTGDGLKNEDASTKIHAGLNEIVGAEMVVLELALVVSLERCF